MGQLGDLAKKVGKEKEGKTYVLAGDGKPAAGEDPQLAAKRKEEERAKAVAEARAKADAAMKGLQKSTSRK